MNLAPNATLLVIDVQKGLDDPGNGRRDNPSCESNVVALVSQWRKENRPVVVVRHDAAGADDPLAPGAPGNAIKDGVAAAVGEPDLLVRKSVSSGFHGTPDLDAWLTEREIGQLVLCGIQTNRCCETTARVARSLGYEILFVLDAMHTFDDTGPDGAVITAEEFARTTAANIDPSFGRVVTTLELTVCPALA